MIAGAQHHLRTPAAAAPESSALISGPGTFWPALSAAAALAAWAATVAARALNKRDNAPVFYGAVGVASALAAFSAYALVNGPLVTRMDPTAHVYPATVWVLVLWTAAHRAAGRYDIDIAVVTLYWHFAAITCVVTVAVIAGFPLTL